MDRRKFLIGAGSVAVGSSALVGSGAFSSAQMNREADINVVNDDEGLIALDPSDDYSEANLNENGELVIDFTTEEGAGGVNVNSRYQVGSMYMNNANLDEPDDLFNVGNNPGLYPAFEVVNQDTTEHDLTLTYEAADDSNGSLVYIQAGHKDEYGFVDDLSVDEDDTTDSIEMDNLGSGEKFGVSIFVDTRDGSVDDDLSGTLTVTAD